MPAYFTDDFNRADEAFSHADWTADAGTWEVVSNQLEMTGNYVDAQLRYSGTISEDQFIEVKVIDSFNYGRSIKLRATSANATTDGYRVAFDGPADNVSVYRGGSLVASIGTSLWTDPAVFRFEASGGDLTTYIDGVEVSSYTDGTPITGGAPSLWCSSDAASIIYDDLSAGDITVQHWLHYGGESYQEHGFPTWMAARDKIVVARARNYGSLTDATGWTTLTGSTNFYQVLERELDATDISNGYVTLDGQPAWGDTAMIGHYLEYGSVVNLSLSTGQVDDSHPNTITVPNLTTTADGATVHVDIRGGALTGGSANLTGQDVAWGTAQYLWGPATGGEFYSYTEPTAGAIGTTDLTATLSDWDSWGIAIIELVPPPPTYYEDDFNRLASTDVDLGGNWGSEGRYGDRFQILGDPFGSALSTTITNNPCATIWQSPTKTDAQFIQADFRVGETTLNQLGLMLNLDAADAFTAVANNPNNAGPDAGYSLRHQGSASDRGYLYRNKVSVHTSTQWPDADHTSVNRLRLEHDGAGTLTCYTEDIERSSYTDGTPLAGRYVGMFSEAPLDNEIDNFSAGDLDYTMDPTGPSATYVTEGYSATNNAADVSAVFTPEADTDYLLIWNHNRNQDTAALNPSATEAVGTNLAAAPTLAALKDYPGTGWGYATAAFTFSTGASVSGDTTLTLAADAGNYDQMWSIYKLDGVGTLSEALVWTTQTGANPGATGTPNDSAGLAAAPADGSLVVTAGTYQVNNGSGDDDILAPTSQMEQVFQRGEPYSIGYVQQSNVRTVRDVTFPNGNAELGSPGNFYAVTLVWAPTPTAEVPSGPLAFSDDFNRADNADIGPDWTNDQYNYSGTWGLKIVNNQIDSEQDWWGGAARLNTLLGAAQFAQADWNSRVSDTAANGEQRLHICADANAELLNMSHDQAGVDTGYGIMRYNWYDPLYLTKDSTVLVTDGGHALDDPRTAMRIEHDGGGGLTVSENGAEVFTYADGSPLGAGHPMVGMRNMPMDNFSAGDLVQSYAEHFGDYTLDEYLDTRSEWSSAITTGNRMRLDHHSDTSNGTLVVDASGAQGAGQWALYNKPLATDDQKVSLTVMPDQLDGNAAGVVLRADASTSALATGTAYSATVRVVGGSVVAYLDAVVGGVVTNLDTATVGAPSKSTLFELEAVAYGSAILVFVDGALVISVSDVSIPTGKYVGIDFRRLLTGTNGQPYVDNWAASDLDYPHVVIEEWLDYNATLLDEQAMVQYNATRIGTFTETATAGDLLIAVMTSRPDNYAGTAHDTVTCTSNGGTLAWNAAGLETTSNHTGAVFWRVATGVETSIDYAFTGASENSQMVTKCEVYSYTVAPGSQFTVTTNSVVTNTNVPAVSYSSPSTWVADTMRFVYASFRSDLATLHISDDWNTLAQSQVDEHYATRSWYKYFPEADSNTVTTASTADATAWVLEVLFTKSLPVSGDPLSAHLGTISVSGTGVLSIMTAAGAVAL